MKTRLTPTPPDSNTAVAPRANAPEVPGSAPSGARLSPTGSPPAVPQPDDEPTRTVQPASTAPAFVYDPPPRPTASLLLASVQTDGSVLHLLFAAAELPAFARTPEPLEVFRARRDDVEAGLRRCADYGGGLELPAQQVQAHPDWRLLAEAVASEQKYQTLVVQGLARGVLEQRLGLLREEVELRFKDGLLTLLEQRLVRERVLQLGLVLGDAGLTIEHVRRRRRDAGLRAEVEQGQPLSGRALDDAGTVIRTPQDLVDLASGHLPAILAQLREAIEAERLKLWLGLHDVRAHAVWPAAERAARRLAAVRGEQERSLALSQGAWGVLWAAGVPWLEVPAPAAGEQPPRVHSVTELASVVEEWGPEAVAGVLEQVLVSEWLRSLPPEKRGTPETLSQALAAEQAARRGARGAAAARLATWRWAWHAGAQGLRLRDGRRVRTAADVLGLETDSEAALEAASDGSLGAWVAWAGLLAGGATGGLEELARLLPWVPPQRWAGQRGLVALLAVQWRLGREDLQVGGLAVREPLPRAVVEASVAGRAAWRGLGESAVTGALPVWLLLRAKSEGMERLAARLASLVGQEDDLAEVAQRAAHLLGEPGLVVFAADEGAAVRLASPADLVVEAHRVWGVLDTASWLPRVHEWLEQQMGRKLETAHTLHTLLARAGDTTIRHLDGRPLGLEHRARFGGLSPTLGTPQATIDKLGAWLGEQPSPPRCLRLAFASGALSLWAGLHWPGLAEEISERVETGGNPDLAFEGLLQVLGDRRIRVDDELCVDRPGELVQHARAHLHGIEELLDSGRLLPRLTPEQRERFDVLEARVDEAATSLMDTADVVETVRVDPAKALVLLDRAALAVQALGGQLDDWRPAPERQRVTGLPPEGAVTAPLHIHEAGQGDAPAWVAFWPAEDPIAGVSLARPSRPEMAGPAPGTTLPVPCAAPRLHERRTELPVALVGHAPDELLAIRTSRPLLEVHRAYPFDRLALGLRSACRVSAASAFLCGVACLGSVQLGVGLAPATAASVIATGASIGLAVGFGQHGMLGWSWLGVASAGLALLAAFL